MSSGPDARWDGCDVGTLARAWNVPRLEAWACLGSTNDRARELAADGAPSWTAVVADEQTRGRGRRGATWVSEPGAGLWMSIVMRRDVPRAGAGHARGMLPLVVGLACAEGIEALVPELTVGLKWPNDLVVGDRKVGGILCERAEGVAVVGIGVNVASGPTGGLGAPTRVRGAAEGDRGAPVAASAPDGLRPMPATALEVEACKPLTRNEVAGAIVTELRRWSTTALDVRAALSDRDVLAGRLVETEQHGPGRAEGIDEDGALVLVRADGSRVRVVAGSVRSSSLDSGRGSSASGR